MVVTQRIYLPSIRFNVIFPCLLSSSNRTFADVSNKILFASSSPLSQQQLQFYAQLMNAFLWAAVTPYRHVTSQHASVLCSLQHLETVQQQTTFMLPNWNHYSPLAESYKASDRLSLMWVCYQSMVQHTMWWSKQFGFITASVFS